MAAIFQSIHLPDLVDGGAKAPARIHRLAAHYGDLVRFASQVEAGKVRQTPVACRRRPGRSGCGGLLTASWDEVGKQVQWQCPNCQAAGVITGWQATSVDLRAMRRGSRRGDCEVAVTVEALAVLRDIGREDPELGRLAFSSQVDAGGRPVLIVGEDERERYRARLLIEAMRGRSRRVAGLLVAIGDALAPSSGELDGKPDLVELGGFDVAELVQQLLSLPDSRPPEYWFANRRQRPARIKSVRRPSMTFQIKVSLRHIRPPIWRRLLVPSDILLPKLHTVLQAAMGWLDCHLHSFRVRDDCYAPPGDWDPVGEDSRDIALVDLAAKQGARLVYTYDFGDGWEHDIVVESVSPEPCKQLRCLAGRRRCPPEDCGGPFGYQEFLAAVASRSHERHGEIREWYGGPFDPEEFDLDDVDAGLRRMKPK